MSEFAFVIIVEVGILSASAPLKTFLIYGSPDDQSDAYNDTIRMGYVDLNHYVSFSYLN